MSRTLVVPTNRPERLPAFFDAWKGKGGWDTVIVVEDSATLSPSHQWNLPPGSRHYCWEAIDNRLRDNSWIISREDSAIRCFGFLMAYHTGAEYVLTLDDDCYPVDYGTPDGPDFFQSHIDSMAFSTWIPSIPGIRTRGLLYLNLGTTTSKVNVGLWTHNADYDAIQSLYFLSEKDARKSVLANDEQGSGNFFPMVGRELVPMGQIIPMCGMNLCFHRDAIPLMYFPLMGKGPLGAVHPYRRFDDIWAGVIVKKCLDWLGWSMSVGDPHVKHIRVSDPMVNLVKEAPGIAYNETFWEEVWKVNLYDTTNSVSAIWRIGATLHAQGEIKKDDYLQMLGTALCIWSTLFGKDTFKEL